MSTAVSFAGGLPDGFGIFGFFFVSVPTALAIFVTSAVGLANVGGLAVVVVVVAAVAVVEAPVSPDPLGMSAVFVLPQAASPMQATASAGHFEWLSSRITRGTLVGPRMQPSRNVRSAATGHDGSHRDTHALEGTSCSRRARLLECLQEWRARRLRRPAPSRRRVASVAAPRRDRRDPRPRRCPHRDPGPPRPLLR